MSYENTKEAQEVRYEGRCIEVAESVWEPLTPVVYEARKQDEQWEVRVVGPLQSELNAREQGRTV